jgi:hypothetical protein
MRSPPGSEFSLLAWVPEILLIVAVALVLILLKRGRLAEWLQWIPARRPRPRHRVTRIVCGTLGLGILAAVAAGTWHEVRRCYAAEPNAAIRVRIPTREAPPPAPGRDEYETPPSARLILYQFVGEPTADGFRTVHAESLEFRWPKDRNRNLVAEYRLGDFTCRFRATLLELYLSSRKPAELMLSCAYSYDVRRRGRGSTMRSGTLIGGDMRYLGTLDRDDETPHPLSIARGCAPDLHAYCLVVRAAEDDPLREAPLDEFIASREETPRPISAGSTPRSGDRYAGSKTVPARGVALARCIGTSGLLLFAAAALLAQLFARRDLASAAVLAGVVLYVALLDRAVLGMHLSRLADPRAPAAARLIACRQSTETFFYRETARRALESVAGDAAAPKALREAAQERATALKSERNLEPH